MTLKLNVTKYIPPKTNYVILGGHGWLAIWWLERHKLVYNSFNSMFMVTKKMLRPNSI